MAARMISTLTVLALTSTLQICDTDSEKPAPAVETKPAPAVETPAAAAIEEGAPAADPCGVPQTAWYLHLSDVHFGENIATQTVKSDTGVALWQATKQRIAELLASDNPPLFVLYTGDLPNHSPDSGELHTHNIEALLGDFQQLFGKTKFLYLPGNNDSLSWDYATFAGPEGQTPLSVSGWPMPTLNVALADPGEPKQGYYSAVVAPGLRVVALNTVMFSSHYPCHGHAGCTEGDRDADVGKQLEWLEGQLKAAAAANERVLLAMHIPPGVDAYAVSGGKTGDATLMWQQANWQNRLLALLGESPAKLAGLAYGHTHMDELRLVHDASGKVNLLALGAPGITPGHGNNPGFKAVSLDANMEAVDALTWYASGTAEGDAVTYAYLANNCFRYAEVFGCNSGSLRECLTAMPITEVATGLAQVYSAQNPARPFTAAYVEPGIDVEFIPTSAP